MIEGKNIFAFLSPRSNMSYRQKRKVDDHPDEELPSEDEQHRHKLHKDHSHGLDLSADYSTSIEPPVSISRLSPDVRGPTESRTSLEDTRNSTLAMEQVLRQAINLHTTEVNDYRERIRFLEELHQTHEPASTFADLSGDHAHAKLKRENERLADELLGAVQELKNHTLAYEHKITAEDINQQLGKLAAKIHTLAEFKFNGLPLGVAIKKDHEKLFKKMSGDYKEYLKDRNRKSSFIEAAIWHRLVDEILSHPAKVFNKTMSVAMDEMQEKVMGLGFHTLCTMYENETRGLDFMSVDAGALQGYHIWRAQTGRLLDNTLYNDGEFYRNGLNDNSYHKLLDDLVGFFGKFCSTPKNLEDLKESFGSIIRQAAALARLLIRCPDFHIIRMPTEYFFVKFPKDVTLKDLSIEDFDLEYMENLNVENMNEEAMEEEDWIIKPECFGFRPNMELMEVALEYKQSSGSDVQLVVSPVLLRYTQEGAGWKEATILTKARVLV